MEENKGGRPGRKAFAPTLEQSAEVSRLIASGRLKRDIASALGISLPTLRKAFAAELAANPSTDLFATTLPSSPPPRAPRPPAGGRPPYTPTDWDRRRIVAMLGGGATVRAVADVVGLSEATIRKHYADEIERAAEIMQARTLDWLQREASKGNVSAIKALREEMAKSDRQKAALAASEAPQIEKLGKKEAATRAAQQVTGRFAPRPPPSTLQ